MPGLNRLLRTHRRLAALVVALALCLKMLVPAGYMVGQADRVVTVLVCADATGGQTARQMILPMKPGGAAGHPSDQDGQGKSQAACAWSSLAKAADAAADPVLLALALAFVLALAFAGQAPPPRRHATRLRPPLRAPPLPA